MNMRLLVLIPLVIAMTTFADDDADEKNDLRYSVVKIHATQRWPSPGRPWTRMPAREATGSGVVIEGNRILTCAHVVAYATEILIETEKVRRRVPARMLHLARNMDLAILTIDDESFFQDHPAVEMDVALPPIGSDVTVYGFPQGGSSLSTTEGVVSRVEYEQLYFDSSGYRIQVDAAVNPGNSGGPAFVNGKLIGIVFSHIREADNIGYVVAAEEVDLFLADVADGVYDGKKRLGVLTRPFEHQPMRDHLGVTSSVSGAVVFASPEGGPLQRLDVITRVGDLEVDDQGMVQLQSGHRASIGGLVQRVGTESGVSMDVYRDGVTRRIQVPFDEREPLIPWEDGRSLPSFMLYGPLVFQSANSHVAEGLMRSIRWTEFLVRIESPILTRRYDHQAFDGEELVVLAAPPLSHPLARGLSSSSALCLDSVNGVPIESLSHLATLLRDATDPFVRFDFGDQNVIVLPRDEASRATEEVMENNDIRVRYSPDIREIWEQK